MKQFEPDDPLALVGVAFPVQAAAEADAEMARVVVEEYALCGFSATEVAALFESPVYTALHRVRRRWGRAFVDGVIGQVYGKDGR